MPIRMTGIVSNLDTDTIIKELMSAQSQKKVKIENKITKNEWATEKWKELNSKIYSFYTGILSKAKTQGEYKAKKVSSSDESKLTATGTNDAVEGSHSVKVDRLASAQHITSGKVTVKDPATGAATDQKMTTSTLLKDLGMTVPSSSNTVAATVINIKTDKKNVDFDVTEESTIGDFLNACKMAGLAANFDSTQGRFFINAGSSGESGAFAITATTSNATDEKNDLRDVFNYEDASSADRYEIDNAILNYASAQAGSTEETKAEETLYNQLIKQTNAKRVSDLTAHFIGTGLTESDAKKAAKNQAAQEKTDFLNGAGAGNPYFDANAAFNQKLTDYKTAYINNENNPSSIDNLAELGKLGLDEITYQKTASGITYNTRTNNAGAALEEAVNSKITYNGAEMTSETNKITANGITFDLKGVTNGETITLSVSKDTDGTYDLVKDFVKGYNEVLTALNEAYNAKSARGYEPLTSEQKEAMTDEEVEKWEKKIKDSLLRRDDTLGSVISTMTNTICGNVSYNGKTYSLASLGISSKLYTEKGILHIAGDSEDALTSGDKDKLKKAINEDPEQVTKIISTLAGNLYKGLTDKMKTSTLSSAMTVYHDKQYSKELDQYKEQLKVMEKKLQDMEDRYYKQFSAMETALSKLNSQSNSLASMLGTN